MKKHWKFKMQYLVKLKFFQVGIFETSTVSPITEILNFHIYHKHLFICQFNSHFIQYLLLLPQLIYIYIYSLYLFSSGLSICSFIIQLRLIKLLSVFLRYISAPTI